MGEVDIKDSQILASQVILDIVRKKEDILIVSNETVDGIISGAILLQSIFDLKGNACVRCMNTNILLYNDGIKEVMNERHYYYIFLDFENKVLSSIGPLFEDNNCLFINSEKTVEVKDGVMESNKLNLSKNSPSDNGYSNQLIATTSKLVYNIVSKFDRKINLKIYLLLVAQVSKQVVKDDSTIFELDKEVIATASDLHLIQRQKGFSFVSKQNKSIINALESNTSCFIKGLTWNRNKVIECLKETEVKFVQENRIKSINELDDNDYEIILEHLQRHTEDSTTKNGFIDKSKKAIKSNLIQSLRNDYILTFEETSSICSGIYSFSRVLESCIHARKFGTAFSLAMGDRVESLKEISEFMEKEDEAIRETGLKIFGEKWRFYDDYTIIFVNGEGVFNNRVAPVFAILLGKSVSYSDRLICLRYIDMQTEEVYKYIIVKGASCDTNFVRFINNLKEALEKVDPMYEKPSTSCHYIRGGLDIFEILVPMKDLEVFLSKIKGLLNNAKLS